MTFNIYVKRELDSLNELVNSYHGLRLSADDPKIVVCYMVVSVNNKPEYHFASFDKLKDAESYDRFYCKEIDLSVYKSDFINLLRDSTVYLESYQISTVELEKKVGFTNV